MRAFLIGRPLILRTITVIIILNSGEQVTYNEVITCQVANGDVMIRIPAPESKDEYKFHEADKYRTVSIFNEVK